MGGWLLMPFGLILSHPAGKLQYIGYSASGSALRLGQQQRRRWFYQRCQVQSSGVSGSGLRSAWQ